MNQTSPPVVIDDPRDGTFIRRFRVEEPGAYELTLERYGDEVTVTFAAVPPAVLDEASLAGVSPDARRAYEDRASRFMVV